MIRIDRSQLHATQKLRQDGAAHLAATIEPNVNAGELTSKHFDSDIYGEDTFKRRLWDTQHGKCCFCEQAYEIKYWTVEHFRPKTQVVDENGNERIGYWWLAYEAENLYFCCPNCNGLKRDHFPLEPGSTPLQPKQKPSDPQCVEAPTFLDPGREDPEQHIAWQWQAGRGYLPTGTTGRGQKTLDRMKLDQRDTLIKLRYAYHRRHLKPVIDMWRQARASGSTQVETLAVDMARRLAEPGSRFAGMARAIFRQRGLL